MARQEAEEYLYSKRDELMRAGYNVKAFVGEASPAEHIMGIAAEQTVDLIVMSTHGRRGLTRWALGSVADKIVRHGPCPVLLIRQKMEFDEESLEEITLAMPEAVA